MDDKDYLMLKYIYEVQNLSKAAEMLYMTPPALTYRLQQLEKEFGVSIVIKNGRSIELTPAGKYLAQYAKKALAEWTKTRDYLLSMSNEVQGILRLGISRVIAHYKLPAILKEFMAMYPRIEVNVHTGISDEVYELLRNEDIHVGIVRGGYAWSGEKYLLSKENVYLISKNEIRIEDLPHLPRINYKHASDFSDEINKWWYERFTLPPLITMQADTFEICKEMVKNDLGYAIIPEIFLEPGDDLHKMALSHKNGAAITLSTWMLHGESSTRLAIVDRFVKLLKTIDFNQPARLNP